MEQLALIMYVGAGSGSLDIPGIPLCPNLEVVPV